MTYILLNIMAFFGPNGEILGNIRLTIWHYQAITDIGAFTQTIGTLLCVDFLSFLINGILLWTFCKINIVTELKNLQKQFWFYMACMEAVVFLEVLILSKALASQFHYKFNFTDFWTNMYWKWTWSYSWVRLVRWQIYFEFNVGCMKALIWWRPCYSMSKIKYPY